MDRRFFKEKKRDFFFIVTLPNETQKFRKIKIGIISNSWTILSVKNLIYPISYIPYRIFIGVNLTSFALGLRGILVIFKLLRFFIIS